jgi:iron-sulfur cluster assembly 1
MSHMTRSRHAFRMFAAPKEKTKLKLKTAVEKTYLTFPNDNEMLHRTHIGSNHRSDLSMLLIVVVATTLLVQNTHHWFTNAWMFRSNAYSTRRYEIYDRLTISQSQPRTLQQILPLHQSTNVDTESSSKEASKGNVNREEIPYDYEIPEDAVVHIKPAAMRRLRELRDQQFQNKPTSENPEFLILRMGVRSGGCSGMSYVMDFCTADTIHIDDDQIDTYEQDCIQCVVDSKSMLYLYGLQLDYSTELIGGGFKFYNPNAEESCGCGSSFGV